jgi:integration host factor subunit alpha
MALTEADLAEKLYEESGFSKCASKEIVEFFFEALRVALEASDSVKLSGFGKFDLREKKQRPGRNPKTGVEVPITARRVVTFRPGQKLRTHVRAHAGNEPPSRATRDSRRSLRP